ncbi:hypothetical protein Acr_14g0000350 [Actinidia rufa]|uniref:Uncharacterized protein n=1 Tax=Actinidia rufa TaxID=165716 RepID=A0A7J0FNV9_9ERIC|nr:hypothetical protein Acr_14g0000350 [Actinidia rufa]
MIDRAMRLGSALLEAGRRSAMVLRVNNVVVSTMIQHAGKALQ